MLNGLTIDLENWYNANLISPYVPDGYHDDRIVPVTRGILTLLRNHNVRATFFVLGEVAESHPDLVKDIQIKGHEIASHGCEHHLVYQLTEEEFEADLTRSQERLEDITGQKIRGFRAPSWSVSNRTPWFFDVLIRNGIRYDSSLFPVKTELFGSPEHPRFPHVVRREKGSLVEFPASTVKLLGKVIPVAGGSFLRVLPLGLNVHGIRSLNRQNIPAVVYFHPWELDGSIPWPRLPRRIRLMHDLGAGKKMERKLRALLGRFEFAPLGEIAGQFELSSAVPAP